jgi:trans-aconitate 2-methyltransferase
VARWTTTDWDAKTYDRLAAPQEEWGQGVLDRLPLDGNETALDAGCGSGRVTRHLLERLPDGRVIGVDGSTSMIETARENLEGYGDRFRAVNSDLLELSPELLREEAGIGSVDAAFSNATFHWITDHDRLFQGLFSVLRPGGQFSAQCGGTGNVEEWVRAVKRASAEEPYAEHLGDFHPWNFVSPEETEERLEAAGFEGVKCWLLELTPYEPPDPRDFVAVVGLAAHHEHLPEELREPFVDAVVAELPEEPKLRYIRLNLDATRPK